METHKKRLVNILKNLNIKKEIIFILVSIFETISAIRYENS